MTTLSIANSMSPSPLRRRGRGVLLTGMVLSLGLLALSSQARAMCREGCEINSGITFLGDEALLNDDTGFGNTAVGDHALYTNNIGNDNTASGFNSLYYNTSGDDNTANGLGALFSNTTGSRNVAIGWSALASNQTGIDNTATGVNALLNNIGNYNTAHGYQALEGNTSGTNNTANGLNALNKNAIGSYNAANGAYALYNDLASSNTADGALALYKNTTGTNNTASGSSALYGNTIGARNIALGYAAGFNLTTGSNNIDIGNLGVAAESNTIRIGTTGTQTGTYIAGIYGATASGGVGVFVDSNGHLGTTTSSARFKEEIHPMDKASEAILALKPVTFRYKQEVDPARTPQFGLVAEEVEKVNPDLVVRDEQGKPYTVRYDAVNAMLLNEFLKAHRKAEEQIQINQQQEATIAELKSQVQVLTLAINDQTAQIQKVSAQLVTNQAVPHFVER